MKLTKDYLRKLIIEEIENLSYEYKKSKTDDIMAHDHPSTVKMKEDSWAGGQNVHWQLDHLKDGGSKEKMVRGIERLKIAEALFSEGANDPDTDEDDADELRDMLSDLDPEGDLSDDEMLRREVERERNIPADPHGMFDKQSMFPDFYDPEDAWPKDVPSPFSTYSDWAPSPFEESEDDYSREQRHRDMHGGYEPPSAAEVAADDGAWDDVEDEWSPHHDPEIIQKDKINESFGRDALKDFFRKYSY